MADEAGWDGRRRTILSHPLEIDAGLPLPPYFTLEVAAATDRGKIQTSNTDHYLAVRLSRGQETLITSLAEADLPPPFEESAYALLVADGLGDHGVGGRASRVALSALAHVAIRYGQWNLRVGPDNAAAIIERGEFYYRLANDAVLRESRADRRLADMATSLTTLLVAGSDLFFAHVGHCRAFLFRRGALARLTVDHTVQQRGFSAPARPTPVEPPRLDLHHVVTESIGGRSDGPNVEMEHVKLWSGDRLLLCTNGLSDVVTEDQIADVLSQQRSPRDDCEQLIERALTAGGPDNVTVLVAEYRQEETLSADAA